MAKHAPAADGDRQLSPEVVAALREAGFARHFVPGRRSGAAGRFVPLGRALERVAEGCLSAAWCAMIYATSGRMAAYLPEEGRAELWDDGPDTLIAAGLVPARGTRAAPGGWRLTGEWRPVSGVRGAEWLLLCAVAPAADESPKLRFFAVPADRARVVDTWDTVGMRGTGSHTVVLDDEFVPRHRTFSHAALFAGAVGHDEADPCHGVPMLGAAPPLFAAPAVGAARGALREWSRGRRGGPDAYARTAEALTFARAAGDTDAAALLLARGLGALDRAPVAEPVAARTARDATLAAEGAVRVVDLLFGASGSGARDTAAPLQRIWRDVHCATTHAALRFERTGAAWARLTAESG
ncbi:hydrolase [Streptomyces sp. NPDC050560]|uniref:hydrolase n=1 Tax=Streptomyces sp. NPDC050560 TaxID=3365630 RepID=UPI003790D1EB